MSEWTEEAPTEKGYYWFYGEVDPCEMYEDEYELRTVEVWGGKNTMYVSEGRFIYPEKVKGKWKKLETPELPELDNE